MEDVPFVIIIAIPLDIFTVRFDALAIRKAKLDSGAHFASKTEYVTVSPIPSCQKLQQKVLTQAASKIQLDCVLSCYLSALQ